MGFLLLVPPAAVAVASSVLPSLFFPRLSSAAGSDASLAEMEGLVKRIMVFTVALIVTLWVAVFSVSPSPALDVSSRLALALRNEVFTVLLLLAAIFNVAVNRGSDVKALSGQRSGVGPRTEIALRVLQNTLEQVVAGVLARLILIVSLPASYAPHAHAWFTVRLSLHRWTCPLLQGIFPRTSRGPRARIPAHHHAHSLCGARRGIFFAPQLKKNSSFTVQDKIKGRRALPDTCMEMT